MRDRLIELLGNSPMLDTIDGDFGKAADFLLANGVIVPPVKVGGKVYIISRNRVKECEVVFIGLSVAENWSHFNFIEPYADGTFYKTHPRGFNEIGKTVFLTREDAEQAMKGGAE